MRKIILSILFSFLLLYTTNSLAIDLKFSNYFPAPSMQSKVCEEFVKDIQERTKGKVQIKYYPGGTLLTAPRMYDGVVEGISDIGFSNVEYTFGRFKATELLILPHGFPTAWVSNHVVNDFYRKYKPKEWDNVHILSFHTCPLYNIITVKKPVYKLEDLKGMNIRAIGVVAKTIAALGGTPRTVPMAEAYDGLTKGVIDGLMTPIETLETWKFAEITKYVTEIWPIGQVNVFYLIMSKKTWDKLPPDVQKVFNEYPFEEKLANMWNEIDIRGKRYGTEKGVKFISLSPEEIKRWKDKISPVVAEYTNKMASEGLSKKDIDERIEYVKSRIEFWSKKQQELKIKSSTGPEGLILK